MTTAYVYDPRHMAHTHSEAPEAPIRVERVLAYLQRQGELDGLLSIPVEVSPWEYVAAVHTGQHLDAVRRWAVTGRSRASLDTFLTPVSPDAALVSASAAVTAVRVEVDDHHPPQPIRFERVSGGNGDVVEDAVAHCPCR